MTDNKIYIFDPNGKDNLSTFRGGGRISQLLKENLQDAKFIRNLESIDQDIDQDKDLTLLIPSWQPFRPSRSERLTKRQYLIIFDVIPLKYSSHFPIGFRGKFNLWKNKQALKHFDKIITISNHSKKDINKYLKIPEEKIGVVYPCLSKSFLPTNNVKCKMNNKLVLHSKFYNLHSKRYALYVGDVNWNKNLVNFARAIKIADISCVFAGKMFPSTLTSEVKEQSGKTSEVDLNHPWQQEYKQFLEEVGNDKRFIFLDYVKDSELIQLYQNAVCNILISRDEGFGLSYLEASSQNCPSILSDNEIFHEIAGDTAIFADCENPKNIVKQIKVLFENTNIRNSLGMKAYKNSKKYSPDKFKSCLEKILKQDY